MFFKNILFFIFEKYKSIFNTKIIYFPVFFVFFLSFLLLKLKSFLGITNPWHHLGLPPVLITYLHLPLLQRLTKIPKPPSKPRTNSLVHNQFFLHYQTFPPWIYLLLWCLMKITISFRKISYSMPSLQIDWKILLMGLDLVQLDFLVLKCKQLI